MKRSCLILSGTRLRISAAWESGDVDLAPMMVGQSIGLIHDIPTCRELFDRMMYEAEAPDFTDKKQDPIAVSINRGDSSSRKIIPPPLKTITKEERRLQNVSYQKTCTVNP